MIVALFSLLAIPAMSLVVLVLSLLPTLNRFTWLADTAD
jgi:hypothetical protein